MFFTTYEGGSADWGRKGAARSSVMFVGEFWLNSDLNRFRTKNDALKAYWGCCRVRLLRMLSVIFLAGAFVFGVLVLMLYAGVIRTWLQVVESPFLVLLGLFVVLLPVELGTEEGRW